MAEFPSAARDAQDRAERLIQGRYDVLGYRDVLWCGADGEIDWQSDPVHGRHPPKGFWARIPFLDPRIGDHKVIWELNRHQHWLMLGRAAWLTGDKRYAAAFRSQLRSWLSNNPPLDGINWASMLEIGLRSISWIWALHFFLPFDNETSTQDLWLVDLLLGLDRQLQHVVRHLSRYFSPNTHLLGEGLALYVAGRVLPEMKSAPSWESLGRDILLREARAQVHRDGGHAELSLHYHRYALDFYLLALSIARQTGDPVAGTFAEVVSRMAAFARTMADNDGCLPTIGDDDGGMLLPVCGRDPADASDSLSLAAALLGRANLSVSNPREEVLWMLGGDRTRLRQPDPARIERSHLFPDTGYAVLRAPTARAILDVGRHGFLNGGHAHADALSIVLSVRDRAVLIDPGTATYTMDPGLRDRFRSAVMHNTVTIDEQPQSVPASPFHWHTSAQAKVTLWRDTAGFAAVEAEHDGYKPQIHRRAVLHTTDDLWLIADHIVGTGRHRFDIHWHLDPAWTLEHISGCVAEMGHPEGLSATIASTAGAMSDFRGDDGGLGWCAPVYGQLKPSLTLRVSGVAQAPVSVITGIAAATTRRPVRLDAAPVEVEEDDGWHRIGAVGCLEHSRFVVMFATSRVVPTETEATPDRQQQRRRQRISTPDGALSTDARIALLRISKSDGPDSLILVDATCADWTGPGSFAFGPVGSAEDLHFDRGALARLSCGSRPRPIDAADLSVCAE